MTYSYNNKFKILIVDDEQVWRSDLSAIIKKAFSPHIQIKTAASLKAAVTAIKENQYDLITVDLKLDEKDLLFKFSGNIFLDEVKYDARNHNTSLLVLSGFPTKENFQNTLSSNYNVMEFIDKGDFSIKAFIKSARNSILKTLQRRKEADSQMRTLITFKLDGEGTLFSISVNAPNLAEEVLLSPPIYFNLNELAAVTNNIGVLITEKKAEWRVTAQSIGQEIFGRIMLQPQITKIFGAVKSSGGGERTLPLFIQFRGAVNCLNIPFELMFNKDFLVFENVITRHLSEGAYIPKSFSKIVDELCKKKEPVRVLVVGTNYGDTRYNFENEAKRIAKTIKTSLDLLEIPNAVFLLSGRKATYQNFIEAIENGCHIFHFAGHSNYSESFPEESFLCFHDRNVSAVQIKNILQRTDTHFVFLSSCLGARVGSEVERGGFHGFMDSLFEAGVTTILGYRWKIEDESAYLFSQYFYENLFKTFCPAQSLFIARSRASLELGRDMDIWASPVMLTQNL